MTVETKDRVSYLHSQSENAGSVVHSRYRSVRFVSEITENYHIDIISQILMILPSHSGLYCNSRIVIVVVIVVTFDWELT
jgi:hypothetical protein